MSLPELDRFLFFFFNQDIRNSFFDIVVPFLTRRAYIVFLPFVVWLFVKDWKRTLTILVISFASLMLADWIGNTFKLYFERIRPCKELEGVRLLVGCGKAFSMPSNHSVNAFAFAMSFFIMLKREKVRYIFLAIAALVAFSRVYVGVHYPSDVAAGALLGVLMAISVVKIYGLASVYYKKNPCLTVLSVFLVAVSIFRIYYILNGPLDLSPDEAHYWEWSRRLDLSYYSKGPMIAYLIYLGTLLFGDNVFGIRIMAVVFSALSSIFLFLLGRRLYDEETGLYSAILIQITPLFSVFGVVFTIDSPFIFFWIVSLFLFYKAVNPGSINDPSAPASENGVKAGFAGNNPGSELSVGVWLMLGVSIGMGLLTKYTMAFFYVCSFFYLLSVKESRRLLRTKGPYISLLISLVVFSPVIIWNAGHDWVTFRHTAGQAHIAEGIQLSSVSFLEFLASQAGVITPVLFMLIAVSIWRLRNNREGRLLFWFLVPIFGFFLLKSIQAKVQANWALPAYIAGIVAVAAFYIRGFASAGSVKKILVAAAVILTLAVTSVAHYPSTLGLPLKFDPSARLDGWKELGQEVGSIYEEMSLKKPVFIFSDRYQISSQLAFYVKGHPVTYCININRRMNQYDLWPGFSHHLHYDAIFVRSGNSRLPEDLASAFQKVEKKVFTAYTKRHLKIRDYTIFMCYDFKGMKERKQEKF
jgi:membrane-associated phospholipid phosphatase